MNLVVTGSDYVGKTSQRFHIRINQHVPKILKCWFDGHSEKPAKNISLQSDSICWTIMSL